MYGWTLRDALTTTYAACADLVSAYSRDDLVNEFIESSTQRAALRVYPNDTKDAETQTVFAAARSMGEDATSGAECGIETLIIMLGANNALSAVTDLGVVDGERISRSSPPPNIASVMSAARFIDHGVSAVKRLLGLEERVGPITDVVAPGSQRSA